MSRIPQALQDRAEAAMKLKYPTAKVVCSYGFGYVGVRVDGYPYPFSVLSTNPIQSAVAKMVGFGVIELDPLYLTNTPGADMPALMADIRTFLTDTIAALGLPPVTIYGWSGIL